MAWDVKYFCEWTDDLGLDWRVDIEKDGSYTATEMNATGDPLVIEYLSSDDDLFEGRIKGSVATFNIYSETNFQWHELFATKDMEFRMSIYYNDGSDHLFCRGYVIPENFTEPYSGSPYTVTISAADGLGILKNMPYKYQTTDPYDTYYDGRLLLSEIINDILAKIEITGFTEYCNIYEESMTATSGYSLFDQERIDADVFRDMYCYEVLEEILKKMNAVIRIVAGAAVIYRPVELAESTVYGRIFTTDTAKTSTNFTPVQYISRTTHTSDLIHVDGGTLMIQGAAKKVTILQNYGSKESWIDNWQFLGSSYNSSTYKFSDWTYPGSGVQNLINVLKGETDGCVLSATTSGPGANPILSQTFGTYALATSDDFMIEFEYFVYSAIDAQNISIAVKLKADNSNHWLYPYDDTEARWNGSEDWIDETVAVGSNEVTTWQTFRRQITSLPTNGTYTIGLYNGTSSVSNGFWGIRNIRFFSTSDLLIPRKVKYYYPFYSQGIPVKLFAKKVVFPRQIIDNKEIAQHIWEKTNPINGKDLQWEILLGDVNDTGLDNVLEQFAGSLSTNVRTLLQRVDDVTLTSDTASGTANITVNGNTETAVWNTSLAQTATDFITAHNGDFPGVNVATGGSGIIKFTGTAGDTLTVTIENDGINPDLTGTVANTQPLTYSDAHDYSTDWNTYFKGGHSTGSESKELLSIIADELAEQYSRPKQFLSLPIIEDDSSGKTPHVNILGNFQDELNQTGGNNRVFVFNKGSFNVRERQWQLDLIEII